MPRRGAREVFGGFQSLTPTWEKMKMKKPAIRMTVILE